MLTDQPLIDATLITELMEQFSHYKPDILYPVYKKQRGNPVIISATSFPKIDRFLRGSGCSISVQRQIINDTSA